MIFNLTAAPQVKQETVFTRTQPGESQTHVMDKRRGRRLDRGHLLRDSGSRGGLRWRGHR